MKQFIMLCTCISLLSACTLEKNKPDTSHEDEAVIKKIISVYDADTFRVALKDWPEYLGQDVGIRVRGIDAPEIRGKCPTEKADAVYARDYVKQRLMTARNVRLSNIETDKYFRLIADVYIDEHSLAKDLIKQKLARPYDGGTRLGWCNKV